MRFWSCLLVLSTACTGQLEDADLDNDGFLAADDCDDDNPNVFPGADEVCDGVDNDCDDETDNEALDALTWYSDSDDDGYGDAEVVVLACAQPATAVDNADDCDDDDWTTHPGATELCDAIDNDCNDEVDDGLDVDGDGYACDDDCDDDNPDVYRGRDEICDGLDNDCDDEIDESHVLYPAEGASSYFADVDGDGYGDPEDEVSACSQPTDFVDNSEDCDDTEATTNPGATETCDGVDNDCDDQVDDGDDLDGDGHDDVCDEDCDDDNDDTYPGATEICDGEDNDCDTEIDEDVPGAQVWYADSDGDSYGDEDTTQAACEAPDDYVANADDCDDDDAGVNPGATETCDGTDENCNDEIDDGVSVTTYYTDADADGYGEDGTGADFCADPGSGYATVDGDCDDDVATTNPLGTETCDGTDENCDGDIDEGLATSPYYVDTDGDGYGEDDTEDDFCADPGSGYSAAGGDCDETSTDVNPGETEVCNNGLDDDCDDTDNGCTPTGTVSLDDADAILAATATNDSFLGISAAGGQDVTGDGLADVVCGAERDDTADTNAGAAYVWADPSGSLTTADATSTLFTSTASDNLGGRAVSFGDIDDDGVADLAVGGFGNDVVAIWYGPITGGTSSAPDALITNDTGSDNNLGIGLAMDGDLNGDGFDDLAVGASTHGGNDGGVYVFYGPIAGNLTTSDADALLEATSGGGQAGGWVAYLGDVVGDGTDALGIGARYDDTGGSDSGRVYVVSGGPTGTVDLSAADAILDGTEASGTLWHSAAAGDVDDDGEDDFWAGGLGQDTTVTNGGQAYLYYGPVSGTFAATDADVTISGDIQGGGLGYDMDNAGDFNGDGEIDFVVGAPYKDSTGASVGTTYVFFGPITADTSSSSADLTLTAATSAGFQGGAVTGAGDVNGDGYDDILIGDYSADAPASNAGSCFVVYGGGI